MQSCVNERFIGVFDSGIGGISLLKDLVKNLPNEKFVYLSDRFNAPFGNKSDRELENIAIKNILQLNNCFQLKGVVFACNTLSVSVRKRVEEKTGVKIYGVYPPVEKYLMKGEKVLLLGTVRTIKNFSNLSNLDYIGFKSLAIDIEHNMFNLKNISIKSNIENSINRFIYKKGYYDRVILGCTHYIFIKNEIIDHFCPRKISSGNEFTLQYILKDLKYKKSSVKYCENNVFFFGENANVNREFYVKCGQCGQN